MNIELTGLYARAAKHAALADPARLRIVDLLTLGDVSPGDLQVMLSIPSNLVAHHLKALESVGIIGRRRSEADRRRSYVQLVTGAFTGLMPGAAEAAHRVVFVCTANSARSQLAAALWERVSSIPAASAGTHPAEHVAVGAVTTAARHDLTLVGDRPRSLSEVLTADDFVVTVCDNAHEEGTVTGNLHWSIPDPVRIGTDAAFDTAFLELERRVTDLAPRLTAS